VNRAGVDEDTLMGVVLDAGADDMKLHGDVYEVTCDPAHFNKVQEELTKNHFTIGNSEIGLLPRTQVEVPDTETAMKAVRLIEALDDHDDVQNVYSNMSMTESVLAEISKG